MKTRGSQMEDGRWQLGIGEWRLWLLYFSFLILLSAFCFRASGQTYSIDWYKIAGGGGTSTGATYQPIFPK
jgi:hypothetical protein